jgi:glycosyltransferase involved in cell wall biosynthesis
MNWHATSRRPVGEVFTMGASSPRNPPKGNSIELSVIVPLFNEAETVDLLVERVREALTSQPSWELLLIDDGSNDGTADRMAKLASQDSRVRPVFLARNYGQTAAMQAGFDAATGRILVSMDGDLQNDPIDIPRLAQKLDEGFDLVIGYRENRQDRFWSRKLPSWLANRLIRRITGVNVRDTGCSLKAYRRELVDHLHLYSDLHRFIPAVAVATVGASTAEVPVRHHARAHGQSKYGISRTWKVLLDLLVIKTIRSGRDRPLALFGFLALAPLVASLVFGILSFVGSVIYDRSWVIFPTLTALLFGLAVYLLMLGLLAETALYHRNRTSPSASPLMAGLGLTERERKLP